VTLTIFILFRTRPDFARLSIQSVIEQSVQHFSLIVSDHSTNNEVEMMMKQYFPDISYVQRSPTLKHLEHFNSCINEVTTDYYCLFHDDDVMHPNFVECMLKFIEGHAGAAAYASNAYVETKGKIEPRLSFLSKNNYEVVGGPRNLALRYFSPNQSGIAPNPSYIYSRSLVGDQFFLVDGGKYADVTLLLDILQKEKILWLNKALMTYRIHGGNLGSAESAPDRLRFLGYLKKHRKLLGEDVVRDYRYSFIYKKIANNLESVHSKKYKVGSKFSNSYVFYRYLRVSTYKKLLNRALIKWATN
jgi:hypothetical protein